ASEARSLALLVVFRALVGASAADYEVHSRGLGQRASRRRSLSNHQPSLSRRAGVPNRADRAVRLLDAPSRGRELLAPHRRNVTADRRRGQRWWREWRWGGGARW